MDNYTSTYLNIISQQYQHLSKGIVYNDDTKILLKNWINSYIKKERYASNIFKFDSYRCLSIQQYSDGIIVISFNVKTAYDDWFPLKRFSEFTENQIDKAIEEVSQWILSR